MVNGNCLWHMLVIADCYHVLQSVLSYLIICFILYIILYLVDFFMLACCEKAPKILSFQNPLEEYDSMMKGVLR